MARVENPHGISGTIHNLVFYKIKNGPWIVRSKGAWISKSKIKNNPRYSKIKQHQTEFGIAAKAGKLLRQAVLSSINCSKDFRVNSRSTQCMIKIIQQDKTNASGGRTVTGGLKTANGKAVMKLLNFNIEAELGNILLTPWKIDSKNHVISIPDMIPAKSLSVPKGATHFSIRGAIGKIDFTNKTYRFKPTNVVNSEIINEVIPVILKPVSLPEGTGFTFFVLKVAFLKVINNIHQPLNNGIYDSLAIIDIV